MVKQQRKKNIRSFLPATEFLFDDQGHEQLALKIYPT